MVTAEFSQSLWIMNDYWDYYKYQEDEMPGLYFTYFYEDLVNDPLNVIKNM